MHAEVHTQAAEQLRRGLQRARTLLVFMIAIGVVAALVSILVLHHSALSEQKARLRELASGQAELLDALVRIERKRGTEAVAAGASSATLSRVAEVTGKFRDSHVSLSVLGRQGSRVVVHVEDGRVNTLNSKPLQDFPEALAERALSAPLGTAEYETRDGTRWLVAHQRVPALEMAVLAKLDFDLLRRPLWAALCISASGSLSIILLGVTLLRKTNVRLVDDLAQALTRRLAAAAELEVQRHHLEQTVEQRTQELREAQNALLLRERLATLGQITAKVSHELRNPLATLRASLFTLRERTKGQENSLGRILDRSDRNVARCDRIIEELLSYTRPGTPRRDTFNVSELLEEVLSDYQPAAPVALEREIEPDIELLADREDVRRMVINLLNNAVDATTERAEGENSVRLVLERAKALVVICVEDKGLGMAEDLLSKAFEPLYSTKGFGIGLGLPIVRELVERNGGSVVLRSHPGQGTRAELKFPARGANP